MIRCMQRAGAHITFSQAGHAYEDGIDACRDISLDVAPGESVALIGPSGCGKSTTLHLVVGLISPTQGTVLVNGAPVDKPRRETAFIPQDLGLLPWKTVIQNAMLPLTLRHVAKSEAAARAREALGQVGLAGRAKAWPRELSGGPRQRPALARALAPAADLLLMDEPLSAVDALLRESLQDVLLDLWKARSHTQLFVTHSIEEAVYLGQRILVFSNRPGTVVADVANPGVGSPAWRDDPAFVRMCRQLREILSDDIAEPQSSGGIR